ncbi:MAG: MaoC family dehydratase [Saprospiraceae bacterium]|nr:MaoC family dehydratase [Saprospiraceae bacterium]
MKKESFKKGDLYSKTITISEEAINNFAEVTGDKNPIHIDEEFASKHLFKKRIAHGFLYGSYISRILGTEFPGIGTIYVSQNMKFIKPVFIGDILNIKIRIIKILPNNKLRLETNIENQNNEIVLKGEAIVFKINI